MEKTNDFRFIFSSIEQLKSEEINNEVFRTIDLINELKTNSINAFDLNSNNENFEYIGYTRT